MFIKNKDSMKKNVVLMLNRAFPVKHKKEGKPTMFANLLYASHKIHTVRMDASGLWEKHCEERLKEAGVPKHIIAQMKLELICKALWGGDVKIYPDPDRYRLYWYPWFGLYSQSEIDDMDDETRGCLLSATAGNGAYAGFGSPSALCRSSYSDAYVGFRLCLDTKEKAEYFGKQFLELWAEAMAFNFSVGERMKQAKKETIKMEAQA